jgi:S-adenosylmethionine hydrolase
MIVLFTDFGPGGLYTGQVKAVLAQDAPDVPVIELLNDAPAFRPRSSAYLLAALAAAFPPAAVFLCVVDPGVGGDRAAVVVEADGRKFVGPDNGLFEIVMRRAAACRVWTITWTPAHLSASFHGRDLFAPVAARLAVGAPVPGEARPGETAQHPDWPDDLAEIIYIDHFGNAVSGLRAATLPPDAVLQAAGHGFARAGVFSEVPPGRALWYENANGLAEIAVNQGRADALGLEVGTVIAL